MNSRHLHGAIYTRLHLCPTGLQGQADMAEAGQGNNALQAPPLWDLQWAQLGPCAMVAFIAALGVQPPGITFFDLLVQCQDCMPLVKAAEALERLLNLGWLLEGAEGLLLPADPAAAHVRNMTELDLSTGPPGQPEELRFLIRLPEGVLQLTALRQLSLSGCENLSFLPQEIDRLTALQQLNLSGCQYLLRLPAGVAQLTALEVLNLFGCYSLRVLPEKIGELTSLRTLDLCNCISLTAVPLSLRNLESLEELHVTGCRLLPTAVKLGRCSFRVKDIQHLGWSVKRKVRCLTRYEAAVEELTTYREPQVKSLERMSWPAILLATATFIGFMQPPWPLGGCASSDLFYSMSKDAGLKDPEGDQMYRCTVVDAFFIFDTLSFSLSIASVLLIIVACAPRGELLHGSKRYEAGRFWMLMFSSWQTLYFSLFCGYMAFLMSAVAVWYWTELLFTLLYFSPVCLVLGCYYMIKHLWTFYPGPDAVRDVPFGIRVLFKYLLGASVGMFLYEGIFGNNTDEDVDLEVGTR
eukprot:jgi/Botrbrau1/3018/Bobra.0070s0014.1